MRGMSRGGRRVSIVLEELYSLACNFNVNTFLPDLVLAEKTYPASDSSTVPCPSAECHLTARSGTAIFYVTSLGGQLSLPGLSRQPPVVHVQ